MYIMHILRIKLVALPQSLCTKLPHQFNLLGLHGCHGPQNICNVLRCKEVAFHCCRMDLAYKSTYTCTHTHTYMYIHIYKYTYMHMYIYIQTFIYI